MSPSKCGDGIRTHGALVMSPTSPPFFFYLSVNGFFLLIMIAAVMVVKMSSRAVVERHSCALAERLKGHSAKTMVSVEFHALPYTGTG
jgi:hypothetical protein